MALAGYLPPIVAQIIADTKGLSAGLGEAEKKLTGFQGAMAKMAGIGKMALAGLGAAAVAVGYESVKLAMNFDQTMELLHTQAGVAQSDVEDLKNKVLALAPAVGIGPEKLAEGLYHIASTGVAARDQMAILTQAARLAQIGMADLDTVTYALSGVMSVGMKDVHSAADAISFMNAAVGEGDMRMQDLANAIGTGVLPSFKSAGLGMNDFVAMLATLADNSVPADEGATRLRMTVALMSAPSGKAAAALKSIGMSSIQMADDMRKPNGGLVAIMDLKKHLESAGLTASQQNKVIEEAFGGGRTSGAILTLLEESDKLKNKYTQQATAAKRAQIAQEAWAKQQQQFKQQLQQLVAQLQVWGVKIGNFLIPKIQELIGWIKQHKQLVKELAIVITAVLLVAILAFVASATAALLMNPFTPWILFIGAIIFLIYELVKHWSTVWGFIKRIAGDAWHWIYNNVWVPFRDEFIGPWITTFKFLSDLWHLRWKAMGDDLASIFKHTIGPIIDLITGGINDITGALNDLTGAGNTATITPKSAFGTPAGGGHSAAGAGRATQGVTFRGAGHLNSFDTGGVVPGPIGAPQLAIVHGGETVTPAGGGDIVIHQRIVTADGKAVRNQTLRYARRAGLKATDVYSVTTVSGNLVRT